MKPWKRSGEAEFDSFLDMESTSVSIQLCLATSCIQPPSPQATQLDTNHQPGYYPTSTLTTVCETKVVVADEGIDPAGMPKWNQ
jgi:hypothetical protein